MPRRVYYRISDRVDGRFDAVVTIEPDTVVRRDGFESLSEVEEWIEGLRVLMAALGAPVAQAHGVEPASQTDAQPQGPASIGHLRPARQ
jgi:hypothetical protein